MDDRRTAHILLAHGSRSEEANAAFSAMAGRVAARMPERRILRAFWELARPSLDEMVGDAVRAGAGRVVVMPYFLSDGVHIRRDIPAALERLRGAHPGVEMVLLPALQNDPLLEELLAARLDGA